MHSYVNILHWRYFNKPALHKYLKSEIEIALEGSQTRMLWIKIHNSEYSTSKRWQGWLSAVKHGNLLCLAVLGLLWTWIKFSCSSWILLLYRTGEKYNSQLFYFQKNIVIWLSNIHDVNIDNWFYGSTGILTYF